MKKTTENDIDTTALMGDVHFTSDKKEENVEQSPLYLALLNTIHEHAEYAHPLDADAQNLGRATGSVSIHTLIDLLEEHGS